MTVKSKATQCSDLWASRESVEGTEHVEVARGSIVISDTDVTR